MSLSCFLALLLFLPLFSHYVQAQNDTATAPTLAETLTPTLNPQPNHAILALFPPSVLAMQTPLAIRYATLFVVALYEPAAACHPIALSFFATKDPIQSEFCTADNAAVISSYMAHRVLQNQFPLDAVTYANFLVEAGLNPFSNSTDMGTPEGWANVIARRLVDYFENDGWNSLGDVTKDDYRQPYEDSTRYSPENPAHLKPGELRRPLRWQPLRFQVDQRGDYGLQEHVVPHIGRKAKPLVISRRQLMSRRVDGPYERPNKWRTFSKKDKNKMQRLIKKLFDTSASLTKEQIVQLAFWENKFISLGTFIGFYQRVLNITDPFVFARLGLGEMLAQHDSLLVAWKEKVRHDLVRPTTMIRRLLRDGTVRAFKSLEEGVGLVKASEWEPVIAIQPHSEFPSASATVCAASLEHLELALRDAVVGENGTIPPYVATFEPNTLPKNPVQETVTFKYATLKQAARRCGMSRLWAGVHFAPSVPAGIKLGTGIGEMAFLHAKDLAEGRVPKNCGRCMKQ